MAIERTWERQGPVLFTTDGGANGVVTVSDVLCFKVKQIVTLSSDSLPDLNLQVKRVLSFTQLVVGPKISKTKTGKTENSLKLKEDISSYTVADNANIRSAEQPKTLIPPNDISQATFEHEPTNAVRTIWVDKVGDAWSTSNPVPITGNITVTLDDANKQDIQNITTPAIANTEFTITLPDKTKRYRIRIRNHSAKGKIGIALGDTASKYWTLTRGTIFDSQKLDLSINSTIYMSVSKASQVVEVITDHFI